MSLESWEKEFYPVEAGKCPKTNLAMLKHTLLKYRGARKENLEKHNVVLMGNYIRCNNYNYIFRFSSQTCSLCHKYLKDSDDIYGCQKCPIGTEGESCDGTEDSAYRKFVFEGNPEPMISLVECLIKEEQKKNRKKREKKCK